MVLQSRTKDSLGSKAKIKVSKHNLGGLPSRREVREIVEGGGFVWNREFHPIDGYRMRDYKRIAAQEEEMLAFEAAGGDLQSDEAEKRFENQEAFNTRIDVGIIGTVIALGAVGCFPTTSCRGGPGHSESHPLVAFWCPAKSWPKVYKAAVATGVSIKGHKESGLIAYHRKDWRALQSFGRALVQRT